MNSPGLCEQNTWSEMFGITENFEFVKRETGSQERKIDFVYSVDRTKVWTRTCSA